jgi:FSR family fosmidomycin resistance protein-like MFS transporter
MSERAAPTANLLDSSERGTALGRERWALGLISAGHYLSHFYGLVLPPLFPLLKAEFGVSYFELGMAMTAYGLLGGFLQAPVGFLVDHLGPRRVLLSGLGLISVSVLFMGFVDAYWMLLVLAVFAGLGNSVFHPADYAILGGSIGERRLGRAYSFHTFSGFLGGACAPVVMLTLAELTDWRTALIATGAVGLCVLALMTFRRNVLVGENDTKTAGGEKSVASSGFTLLLTPQILLFLGFFILYGMASGGLLAFTVSGLVNLHGLGLDIANTALTAHLFGVVGGILLAGMIADRYPRHIVTAGGALLLAAGAAVLPAVFVPSGGALLVIMAVAGVGLGAVLPPRDLMLKALTPPGQTGKVFGFVFVGYAIGGSIAPLLLGSFLDAGRPELVFLVSSGFAILALVAITAVRALTPRT